MKGWHLKMDWALLIRIIFGMSFIVIGFQFKDWMPGIFGSVIIIIGIIAAFSKTGCGYQDRCN
jgi:uncharacterized membrane protein YphA (DoxX/SURF4 family)